MYFIIIFILKTKYWLTRPDIIYERKHVTKSQSSIFVIVPWRCVNYLLDYWYCWSQINNIIWQCVGGWKIGYKTREFLWKIVDHSKNMSLNTQNALRGITSHSRDVRSCLSRKLLEHYDILIVFFFVIGTICIKTV